MVYTSVVNLLGSGKTNNFLMWTRSYSRKPVHKCYSGSVKECNLSKTSVSSGSVRPKMVLILFPGKAGGILNVWVVESIYPILHWNLLKQSVCRVSIHKTQNIAKLIQLIYQPSRFIHILQIMKVIWIQVQTTQHQLQSEWTSSKFSKSWFFLKTKILQSFKKNVIHHINLDIVDKDKTIW